LNANLLVNFIFHGQSTSSIWKVYDRIRLDDYTGGLYFLHFVKRPLNF